MVAAQCKVYVPWAGCVTPHSPTNLNLQGGPAPWKVHRVARECSPPGEPAFVLLFPFLEGRVMEWYTFGLDKVLMFIFATSSATVIVLTVMFLKSVIEKGPKKYIEMN
jgi:hypothetical protein